MGPAIEPVERADVGPRMIGDGLESLPAELRELIEAWQFLESRVDPQRAVGYGRSRSSSQWRRPDDPARKGWRKYRDARRKEIGRLAESIDKALRGVVYCKRCGDQNSREDVYCGESKPEGKGCGAWLDEKRAARTDVADA